MSESLKSPYRATSGSSRAWKQHSETLSQPAPSQDNQPKNDISQHNIASNISSAVGLHGSDDLSPISTISNDCVKCYQSLHDTLDKSTVEEAAEAGFDRDAALALTQDAQSRFKAWGLNIAAFQKGHLKSSLDSRLKEAKDIRERILRILRDLKESLETATLIVSGSRPNEKWQPSALSDSDDDEILNEDEAGVETSELDELFTAIKAANVSLMKLSLVIRTSPTRDDYLKAASRYELDARWDIGHVREKYGKAKRSADWLIERMGKAITRRRQYLKYRAEHHEKLSRDWEEVPKDPGPIDQKTIALTKATTFVEAKTNIDKDESDGKGSFGSQTSYEPTVVGEDVHKLTTPAPPRFAFEGIPFEFGEPFRCPYCYTEQVVKNKTAWKKHVFRDLKPYVCTFKECELKMFRSRNEWWLHELHNHRREWVCATCYTPFNSKSTFVAHLKSSHNITLSGSQLEALILKGEEPVDKIPASACMLCDEWETNLLDPKQDAKRAFLNDGAKVEPCGTLAQFRRHLGRHMEQLALFALPMAEGDGMEDDSIGEDEVASHPSNESDGVSAAVSVDSAIMLNAIIYQQPEVNELLRELWRKYSKRIDEVKMRRELNILNNEESATLVRQLLYFLRNNGSPEELKMIELRFGVSSPDPEPSNPNPDTATTASERTPMQDLGDIFLHYTAVVKPRCERFISRLPPDQEHDMRQREYKDLSEIIKDLIHTKLASIDLATDIATREERLELEEELMNTQNRLTSAWLRETPKNVAEAGNPDQVFDVELDAKVQDSSRYEQTEDSERPANNIFNTLIEEAEEVEDISSLVDDDSNSLPSVIEAPTKIVNEVALTSGLLVEHAMNAPAFFQPGQAYRASNAGQQTYQSLSMTTMNAFASEASANNSQTSGAFTSGPCSVLIRRLPLDITEAKLKYMVVWSKEFTEAEVLSPEKSEDPGFRSAILRFKSYAGALEAKNTLDGKAADDVSMIVEVLYGSPTSSRRYTIDNTANTGPSSTTSSASSAGPTPRQSSRYNGTFQSTQRVSPTNGGAYSSNELPNPEVSTHYQSLFSPQSPIGNHLNGPSRITGKSLINNDSVDDDETGELLKDPVAYAENGPSVQGRRPTNLQIPISRMAGLSLNTNNAAGPASISSSFVAATPHGLNPMSPTLTNGGPPVNYQLGSQHYRRHNFPPVNPADQNPPCNTLYVGNLPIDTSEDELKAMFSKQRGYKRLCFRTKQNGPMCFVEFEDVSFATKALHELYGHPLHNSIKGGIKLSFSKNPLGVRSG